MAVNLNDIKKAADLRKKAFKEEMSEIEQVKLVRNQIKEIDREIAQLATEYNKATGKAKEKALEALKASKKEKSEIKDTVSMLSDEAEAYDTITKRMDKMSKSSREILGFSEKRGAIEFAAGEAAKKAAQGNEKVAEVMNDIIGILNSDDVYYPEALSIVNKYFSSNPDIDFLFGSVHKHKLMSGFYPEKIKWTFGFYTTHSVGFFIKKSSQINLGFYDIQYKFSADYDLFYRMIVKKNYKGLSTKKDEILGKFRQGGLSSRIRYLDFLKENNKIRINNGQNKLIVYIIFLLRLIRNFNKIFN